ncbi:protein Pop3 [Pyrus ussuriensis x Pyrus communis]|uniref:Protein Pop3 n=1 Tax=Pyrus ussuriensis x Pyrus communis TaxID=2448454 RepID=A0A5N5HEV1_9ROSA|nr:protein Pop3 [Pyrus ussuriensis x Pyrus communis]
MEEAKGVVMHVVLAKFKDGIAENKIEEIIKDFANLVNIIEPMKSFNWGKDVSSENLNQGFTHIFESTFESTEGVAEYVAHPAHVDFANLFLSHVEKVIVIDYKPTALNPTNNVFNLFYADSLRSSMLEHQRRDGEREICNAFGASDSLALDWTTHCTSGM